MSLAESVNLEHAQRPVPCDACEDEVPGTYYCIQCKKTLCEECEKFHRKFTNDHNVVLRTQVGEIDIASLNCGEHDEHATFHCEKCNISVCSKCVTGKHQGHKMVDMKEIISKKSEIVQNNIKEIKTNILPDLFIRRDAVQAKRESYDEKIKEVTEGMELENDTLHKELDRIHNERMKNLASIRESHMIIFDNCSREIQKRIEQLERRASECQHAVEKKSLHSLMKYAEENAVLPVLSITQELPDPPSFLHRDIQEIVETAHLLGLSSSVDIKRMKVTAPEVVSNFKSPMKGCPSIFITNGNDVWLTGNDTLCIAKVDKEGNVLVKRNVKNRPTAMAVMISGDVIISPRNTDSNSISKLLADDKEVHVFDTSPSCGFGVSVTARQNLLVCSLSGKVVKMNSDGTNAMKIYEGSGDRSAIHAVESSDGNIYISDSKTPAIVVMKKEGKIHSILKKTANEEKFGRPFGLVIDKMNNVLCSDRDKHCVYIIDQDQQVSELVGRSHGIKEPRWLAIDGDNNLWITQYDGTVKIVKYIIS